MIDPRFYGVPQTLSASQVADVTGAELQGNPEYLFDGTGKLQGAGPTCLSFFHNTRYLDDLKTTKAGGVILAEEFANAAPRDTIKFITRTPYRAFAKIINVFYPALNEGGGIHPTAVIHPSAKIGKNCFIGPYVIIDENTEIGDGTCIDAYSFVGRAVTIGQNCHIRSHVTLSYCLVASCVHIKPGARIGQRGFGFEMDEKGPIDMPQMGRVVIEDYVEVGANTCIDRGSQGDTVIGRGSRIDNLVQIAHNVKLGRNCILVAQVGIAGSTELGNYVVVAGQVGISGHLKIGDGVRIGAQSGVMRDILAKTDVAGSPAVSARDWHRQTVMLKRMLSRERIVKEQMKKASK